MSAFHIKLLLIKASLLLLLVSFTPSVKAEEPSMSVKNIDTQELIQYQNDPEVLIVDVREKSEIEKTGILPAAVNIPLSQVGDALSKSPEEFKQLYGKVKPNKETKIVFSCQSGRRSLAATETALKLGYLNSLNYSGGWLGWQEHLKKNP